MWRTPRSSGPPTVTGPKSWSLAPHETADAGNRGPRGHTRPGMPQLWRLAPRPGPRCQATGYPSLSRVSVRSRWSRHVPSVPRCQVSAKRPRVRDNLAGKPPAPGRHEPHPPGARSVGHGVVQPVHLGPLDVDLEGDVRIPLAGVVGHLAEALVAQCVRTVAVDDRAVVLEQRDQGVGIGRRQGVGVADVRLPDGVADRVVRRLELLGVDPLERRVPPRVFWILAGPRTRRTLARSGQRSPPIEAASIDSTLSRRRRWRGSPEKRAARNAAAHSAAGSIPMTLAPIARTFMSSCSTPWCAE